MYLCTFRKAYVRMTSFLETKNNSGNNFEPGAIKKLLNNSRLNLKIKLVYKTKKKKTTKNKKKRVYKVCFYGLQTIQDEYFKNVMLHVTFITLFKQIYFSIQE